MNRSSLGTLFLTALSAIAVLALGAQLARKQHTTVDEESRVLRMTFAVQCLRKLDDLSVLYQNHLTDICQHVLDSSDIEITSRARNIVGIEQVTVFPTSARKRVLEIQRKQNGSNSPRLIGTEPNSEGLLIDSAVIPKWTFDDEANWIDKPGYPPHYAAWVADDFGDIEALVVIRLNSTAISNSIDNWFGLWLNDELEPLEYAGIKLVLKNSDTDSVVAESMIDQPLPRNTESAGIFPLRSRLGNWQVASVDKTETQITYHPVILSVSAALALLIGLIGGYVYLQQRNATRAAEQRVSFVNQVSHELRTPMTNILLNLDIASESIPLNSKAGERLALVHEETSRLSRLLENVLTFSHSNASRQNKLAATRTKSCPLAPIINELMEQFQPSLSRKGLRPITVFRVDDIDVLAEPDGLNQILSNLISNVEKYASNGDSFEIEIDRVDGAGQVLIAVSDYGPGISPSDAAHIFMPFTRLSDATSEGVSGTGLGLAIAKDLARKMGGELQVLPRADKHTGARFELTLPIAIS